MDLFPAIEPYMSGMLKVSDLHSIYYDVSGNPAGKPALVIHGGPGSGSHSVNRRYFDPAVFRIVLFDQRGAGQSTPWAELEDNDTWALVEDMEKLRKHLNIERWMLFGGSWGSTLALAYALEYSARVTALVLRGIFTCRAREIQWLYQEGASRVFPDYWSGFVAPIPEEERTDLVSAYHRRLSVAVRIGDDGAPCGRSAAELDELKVCASSWSRWECAVSQLFVKEKSLARADNSTWAIPIARIECHYFVNNGFMTSDSHLLDNVARIGHIPCVIVQGRYDMVCPMETAYELHKRIPGADFIVVDDAGHSRGEPGITAALLAKVAELSVV